MSDVPVWCKCLLMISCSLLAGGIGIGILCLVAAGAWDVIEKRVSDMRWDKAKIKMK